MRKEHTTISMLSFALVLIVITPNFLFSVCEAEAQQQSAGPKSLEKWFEKLPNAKEKTTKLHFYFHDVVSGNNPTAIPVARANSTATSPTLFGLVSTIDNPLTVGPGPRSKIMGRAQGITGYTSFQELGLLMTMNFVFTDDKYNGSTLSVVGCNPIGRQYREMPIVGGSGVFRLARGVAVAETAKFNLRLGNAVVEYNVIVLHY